MQICLLPYDRIPSCQQVEHLSNSNSTPTSSSNEMGQYLPNRLSFSWLIHGAETFGRVQFHFHSRMIRQWRLWLPQWPV